MTSRQGELFSSGEGDSAERETPTYYPDPEKVRSRLLKILAEAREAETLPWEPSTLSLYRLIFPQMSQCLPEEEGRQLCFEFEQELARFDEAA